MSNDPLVSVLMPCKNGEAWIRYALESCLNQTHPNIEVLVYDDESTDSTAETVRSLGSDRIRLFREGWKGVGGSRNFLVEQMRGQWIQLLDHDDYLLPDKISGQMAYLREHPDVDFVYGPITLEYWEDGVFSHQRLVELPEEEQQDPWLMLARRHIPQTGAPLMRRAVWKEFGGHTDTPHLGMELEYYSKYLIAGARMAYHPMPGAIYRLWGRTSLSHRASIEQRLAQKVMFARILRHLEDRGELTTVRLEAFNETLFRIAHRTMSDDPAAAREIFREIHRRQPNFRPPADLRRGYRSLYGLGGWRLAEGVGEFRRHLFPKSTK